MKARPLTPLLALSAAFVVGCGSSPARVGEGVAPLGGSAAARALPARESPVQFEPDRGGDRRGSLTEDDGSGIAGGAGLRPEVRAARDRVLAQADAFDNGPSARRPTARTPANRSSLNDRTLDEQAEQSTQTAVTPAPAGVARSSVRRGPSATPLAPQAADAFAGAPATPPAVPVPPHVASPTIAPAAPAATVPTPAGTPATTDPAGGAGPGKAEVAVGGPGGTAGPGDDGTRLHNNNRAPDLTVYGNNADDLEARLARKVKETPQDLAAQLDFQLFQLLKTDGVGPLPAANGLAKEDRNLLGAFTAGLANLRTVLAADTSPLMAEKMRPILDMAEQVRGQATISVPVVELCSKVSGFGVYEPLQHKFRAGVDHPVIVYSEVQNFTSQPTGGQFWETKLSLEVTLATSDGTVIWNDKNNVPVDVSRNRRRDFFVVKQMVLPRTLAVGKYLLKVSVTDEHAHRTADFNSDITMTAQ